MSYPVIYSPGVGSAEKKIRKPLGYATTEQGAIRHASRKIPKARFERFTATLAEVLDGNANTIGWAWYVGVSLKGRES